MRAAVLDRFKKILKIESGAVKRPKVGQIHDISDEDLSIIKDVRPYTMTSNLRIEALLQSVRYCEIRKVPGAFVECGVWRGGSVMAMLLQLLALGVRDRDIYLYDTFEGMTKPTEKDISVFEDPAIETWHKSHYKGEKPWSRFFTEDIFNEQDVKELLYSTGYPKKRLHFIKGAVEDTIPGALPESISLLRLDTDWYESTRYELEHLYPLLTTKGVLIIDDYGHWQGARKAVDEYFEKTAEPVLLNRIDYSGRLAIKV